MRLNGKSAIVTGAGTGLGLAIAKRYAEEGASVVAVDLKGHQEAAAAIEAAGGRAIGVRADISSEDDVEAMVVRTVEAFGKVDVLVNNAAVSQTLQQKPFEQIDIGEFQRVMDVNILGVFLAIRAVTPHMRAQKSGSIINFGSGTVIKGSPNLAHYVASKAAVHSLTRTLARELGADNITVNAIAPGYILTEGNLNNEAFLTIQRDLAIRTRSIPRDGYPDDITGAAVFFASDDARFVSGQILPVDGGSA